MGKEKKIGIKHYLNKNLKPVSSNGSERYPVYIQITFDRNNTKFAHPLSDLFDDGYLTESEFENLFESKHDARIRASVENLEKGIRNVIRFEEQKLKNRFMLKGFADRFNGYFLSLTWIIEKSLQQLMDDFLKDELSEEEFESVSHKLFSFEERYFMVKRNFIEDLPEVMPDFMRLATQAYSYLFGYLDKVNLPYDIPALQWMDDQFRQGYKDLLMDSKFIQPVDIFELPLSNAALIVSDLGPVEELKIHKCLNFIDTCILE